MAANDNIPYQYIAEAICMRRGLARRGCFKTPREASDWVGQMERDGFRWHGTLGGRSDLPWGEHGAVFCVDGFLGAMGEWWDG